MKTYRLVIILLFLVPMLFVRLTCSPELEKETLVYDNVTIENLGPVWWIIEAAPADEVRFGTDSDNTPSIVITKGQTGTVFVYTIIPSRKAETDPARETRFTVEVFSPDLTDGEVSEQFNAQRAQPTDLAFGIEKNPSNRAFDKAIDSEFDEKLIITALDDGVRDGVDRIITLSLNAVLDPTEPIGYEADPTKPRIINVVIIDPEETSVARASFEPLSTTSISETEEDLVVTVALDAPAPAAGNLRVNASGTATINQDYTISAVGATVADVTNPTGFTVSYEEGDEQVSFTLSSTPDSDVEGDETIDLELSTNQDAGIVLAETNTSVSITLTDVVDAGPTVAANFQGTGTTINEDDFLNPALVTINFSEPTLSAGSIEVTFGGTALVSNADPSADAFTEPVDQGGVVTLPFDQGASSVSFQVIPVGDSVSDDNETIICSLQVPDGVTGLSVGSTQPTYTITIEESVP